MATKKQGFLRTYFAKPLSVTKNVVVAIPSLIPFLKNQKIQLDKWSEIVRQKLKNPALSNYVLGEKFFAEEKHSDAITRFKIACYMKKDYAQSYFMMAKSYLSTGKLDKAIASLKKAQEHKLKGKEFSYFCDIYLKDNFKSQPDINVRKRYFDSIAAVMDEYYIENFSYEGVSKINDLFAQHTTQKTKNILELGCGNGLLAANIKEAYTDLSITGLDSSKDMINNAKLFKTIANQKDVTVLDLKNDTEEKTDKEISVYDYLVTADLNDYDSGGTKYDAVLARGVFNYIDNYDDAIARISKLLKSKGIFILYLRKELDQEDYQNIRDDFSFPFFSNFVIHDTEQFVKSCKKHAITLVTKQDFTLEIKYNATALIFKKS